MRIHSQGTSLVEVVIAFSIFAWIIVMLATAQIRAMQHVTTTRMLRLASVQIQNLQQLLILPLDKSMLISQWQHRCQMMLGVVECKADAQTGHISIAWQQQSGELQCKLTNTVLD